jgi:hypothetical protein
VFFIFLERSWSVNVQNGLAWSIWTYVTQVLVERRAGPGVKLAVWLPTTKSQELTWSRCAQVECDTPLESSREELQVCFEPCLDRRLGREVMNAQSPGSPNWDSFRTPLWESREKVPFGCRCGEVMQRILYGGRWWLPSRSSCSESSESKVAHGLSQHQNVPNVN